MGWHTLFDSDFAQRRDIDRLREDTGRQEAEVWDLRNEITRLRMRCGKLELVAEALLWILEAKVGITRDEVELMIQRIDLCDGFEDGQLGPDRSETAPRCPSCARPVNPRRDHCIFCGAALGGGEAGGGPYRGGGTGPRQEQRQRALPPEKVTCAVCGDAILKEHSETVEGKVVCARCSYQVGG